MRCLSRLPLLAFTLLACTAMPEIDRPASASVVAGKAAGLSVMPPGGEAGARLEITLGEAQPSDGAADRVRAVDGRALSEAETSALLSRLPALKSAASDRKDFALRPTSLKAPRPGLTIESSFPPEPGAEPPTVEQGPLQVLRHGPEGRIPGAPALSLTFSHPMVPLGSHGDLAARQRPVSLEPEPPGNWRWVGTRTLLFEPDGGFPRSTLFKAQVPEGLESETSGRLAEGLTWAFETPRLLLTGQFPLGGATPLQPILVLGFDQAIDAEALLPFVVARAGEREIALRLATAEELAADENAKRVHDAIDPKKRLALQLEQPLPPSTQVEVSVKAGAPSAEGPLKTESNQSYFFQTHGPLRVVSHRCGWDEECRPEWPWSIELSNPIDADRFEESLVTVEPELPGLSVQASGQHLTIHGFQRARTRYTVTLAPALSDVFGQQLGASEPMHFHVGEAQPELRLASSELVVLDPSGPRELPVFSRGYETLVVLVHAATPEQWSEWIEWKRSRGERRRGALPGRRASSETLRVAGSIDELVETRIDLRPALTEGLGHVIVNVVAGKVPVDMREAPEVAAWVQATNIGLDAHVDSEELLVWTNVLADGAPLSGVEVRLEPAGLIATSGPDALARLSLPKTGGALLLARRGGDSAFLPQNLWSWERSGWQAQEHRDQLLWHVFDDRGLYKPGETARLKGWVRTRQAGKRGETVLPSPAPRLVAWQLHDSRGNEIAKGESQVSRLAGFDLEIALPDDMNLGQAQVILEAMGEGLPASTRFFRQLEVQEFRRPEYEVKTQVAEGPFFAGDSAELTVTADYFAGGHLPGADVTWTVTQRPGEFRPPHWRDFRFGRWVPWWWGPGPMARGGGMSWPHGDGGEETVSHAGTTNALGAHHLKLELGQAEPPLPISITASASVEDLNRQAWSDSSALLVHPADLYVGLRSSKAFVENGEPLHVDVIVSDLDGKAVAGREVVLEAERSKTRWSRGAFQEEWTDRLECRPTSGAAPVTCSFHPPTGGRWRVRALVTDDAGRKNLTEITIWVAGGELIPSRGVEEESVELIPEGEELRPGDTARILVQAPFAPAEGLLSLRRDGLVETRRFRMESASTVLEIEVDESSVPNLHVVVELVGRQLRVGAKGLPDEQLPKRPAFARGSLELRVPPVTRALKVELTPKDPQSEPGASTEVAIRVSLENGEPLRDAEIALVVADEAVLALTGYQVLDPLDSFHPDRGDGVQELRSRAYLLLTDPRDLQTSAGAIDGSGNAPGSPKMMRMMAMAPTAEMMSMDGGGSGGAPIRLRSDFDPIAVFAPLVTTDAEGRASVAVELPDNLTRYRVFAVAVAGKAGGGIGESSITARLPVMARLQPPRFLNFGDRVELPLVIQNQTASTRSVEVALRASNLEFEGQASRRVEVAGHDRIELRFPARTEEAGRARIQVAISSGSHADAMEVELPVWTPATTEAFATYGELDAGAVLQPLELPSGTWPQFGGLEITTSSTAMQGLTDAVLSLVHYPFSCAEQVASRILAIAALRDVLVAFDAEGLPPVAELEARVRADLEELSRRQNSDGGFSLWRRGEESWPFVSIQVAHAVQRAQEKGFEVPTRLEEGCKRYLSSFESELKRLQWSDQGGRALLAQALYVRERFGDADPKRARRLFEEAGLEGLSLESLGWLLPTLHGAGASTEVAAIRRHLLNQVSETAATAEFSTSYASDSWRMFHSSRRSDAVLLEALLRVEPELDLVPKLARGLLAHRKRGSWDSTQENAWVLLSLDAYFRKFESVTPDFVARVWLGDGLALEQEFRGRSTESHQAQVPMAHLLTGPQRQDLSVDKEGAGRLYWRLGLRYAPRSLELEPAAQGFEVERSYESIDDPDDVRRDDDGTWRVKAGARVRVRVSMATPARRYHVALVDPLPAGFESLNPTLAVTEALPPDDSERPQGWWWGRWYEHENLRDERAEAFSSLLWPGAHSYSYVCRATTPGRFVVPPARAEEMYFPETFGRSGSEIVVIE